MYSSPLGDRPKHVNKVPHDVKRALWWKHALCRNMCVIASDGLSSLIALLPLLEVCEGNAFEHVCLSVSLSVCLSICLPVCLSVCLSACLPACLSVCLSVCLYVCLSVCLSVCMSVCLSVCLHVIPHPSPNCSHPSWSTLHHLLQHYNPWPPFAAATTPLPHQLIKALLLP